MRVMTYANKTTFILPALELSPITQAQSVDKHLEKHALGAVAGDPRMWH